MNSLEALIPELRDAAKALVDLAGRAGVGPRLTSTLRTHMEQEKLYRRYLAGLSRFPAAPPGTSAHEYGYAFDLLVEGDQNQFDLGSVWQSWGGIWGGARDPIHFQLPGFSPAAFGGVGPAGAPVPSELNLVPIGQAVDILIGLNPVMGTIELAAELTKLGFPESEIADFLSGPAAYVIQHPF